MGDVKHATGLTAMNETTLTNFLTQHGRSWGELKQSMLTFKVGAGAAQ